MPKKQRFQTQPVGLSNDSLLTPQPVNEEEVRIEAVEEVLSVKPNLEILDIPEQSDGIRVEVLIERLNFRDSANPTARILFPAKKGDMFVTDSMDGEWLSVRTTDGTNQRGFVVAKYVKEVDHGQHS